MKKLMFVSLAAVMASFAASADTIVTSKTYVDSKDNLKQNAITAGAANSVALYTGTTTTNGGADFTSRNLYSDTTASNYVAGTHATYIPTMGAVMAQIQNSAVTLPTGTAGSVVLYGTGGALDGTGRAIATTLGTDTTATTLPTTGAVVTGLNGKQNELSANNATTYPNGSLVAYGTTAGTPSTKKIVTTVAANGTDIPTDGAVYSAVNAVQTQVTTLANCKHQCADSGCTLINVTCVDAYNPA